MPVQLNLTNERSEEWLQICGIDHSSLKALLERLNTITPAILELSKLRKELSEELGSTLGSLVGRNLLRLVSIGYDQRQSAKAIIKGLISGFEAADWSKEDLDQFENIRPTIEALLDVDSISMVAKAVKLSYDYENILQDVRIITDIRPLFDETRENITGSIVMQTLRLDYFCDETGKSISLALDEKDVKKLFKISKEALQKSMSAKELLENKCHVHSFITGEERDD